MSANDARLVIDPLFFYGDYADPVERARARILTFFLFATVPFAIVMGVLVFASRGVLILSELASPLVVFFCLFSLRRKIGPKRVGFAFGVFMELIFVESILKTNSNAAFLWLSFFPFIAVFISGRRAASFLLVLPIATTLSGLLLTKAAPQLLPGFAAMFRTANIYMDIVAFHSFVFVLFFVAVSFEALALGSYRSYLFERAETESELRARRAKEETLASSLKLLEAVFAAIPLPVFIKDSQLRFIAFSSAYLEFMGKEQADLLGRTVQELYEGEILAAHEEADRRLLETGRAQYYPSKSIRRDGQIRSVLTLKTPLKDSNGSVTGIIGVFEDQTDRIEGEKKLLALLEERRNALALIGHDLRNPIGSFRSLVRVIREDEKIDPAEYRQVLEELERSLDSLWTLIDELLDWAREDAGLADYRPCRFNAAYAAEAVAALHANAAKEKRIRYETRIDGALECWGDERMVSTILRNLVSNALKFTPKGGSVLVSAERADPSGGSGAGTRFVVADTGIGIPDSYLASLFGTETLRSRRGTSGEPGTGLGIRLCQKLAERHGGGITVESVVGAGTVFSVFLPDPEKAAAEIAGGVV